MPSYKGISFPPRIGPKGGWLMSVADATETTKIKESIYLVLTTRVFERVMENRFGSRLLDSVFENANITLMNILKYQIEQALTQFEPRIKTTNIDISIDTDGVTVNVRIDYMVLNLQIQDSTTVALGGGR